MIELLVFETGRRSVDLVNAGYSSFIVDCEYIGKDLRQLGFNTEINRNTFEDISYLKNIGARSVWTRINCFGAYTNEEIEKAISCGTTHIILPMVRSTAEVDLTLRYVDDRVKVCVMIETPEGVSIAHQLARMSISAAYFGLNDYSISTSNRNIFAPISDGVIDKVRGILRAKKFGFGGLTHPLCGHPIPSIKILHELERLECSFTFLRRSFRKDLSIYGAKPILEAIVSEWNKSRVRSNDERSAHHIELRQLIADIGRGALI